LAKVIPTTSSSRENIPVLGNEIWNLLSKGEILQ
jgi:hypothetical protein